MHIRATTALLLVLAVGCGRVGFDPLGDRDGDGGPIGGGDGGQLPTADSCGVELRAQEEFRASSVLFFEADGTFISSQPVTGDGIVALEDCQEGTILTLVLEGAGKGSARGLGGGNLYQTFSLHALGPGSLVGFAPPDVVEFNLSVPAIDGTTEYTASVGCGQVEFVLPLEAPLQVPRCQDAPTELMLTASDALGSNAFAYAGDLQTPAGGAPIDVTIEAWDQTPRTINLMAINLPATPAEYNLEHAFRGQQGLLAIDSKEFNENDVAGGTLNASVVGPAAEQLSSEVFALSTGNESQRVSRSIEVSPGTQPTLDFADFRAPLNSASEITLADGRLGMTIDAPYPLTDFEVQLVIFVWPDGAGDSHVDFVVTPGGPPPFRPQAFPDALSRYRYDGSPAGFDYSGLTTRGLSYAAFVRNFFLFAQEGSFRVGIVDEVGSSGGFEGG